MNEDVGVNDGTINDMNEMNEAFLSTTKEWGLYEKN